MKISVKAHKVINQPMKNKGQNEHKFINAILTWIYQTNHHQTMWFKSCCCCFICIQQYQAQDQQCSCLTLFVWPDKCITMKLGKCIQSQTLWLIKKIIWILAELCSLSLTEQCLHRNHIFPYSEVLQWVQVWQIHTLLSLSLTVVKIY